MGFSLAALGNFKLKENLKDKLPVAATVMQHPGHLRQRYAGEVVNCPLYSLWEVLITNPSGVAKEAALCPIQGTGFRNFRKWGVHKHPGFGKGTS